MPSKDAWAAAEECVDIIEDGTLEIDGVKYRLGNYVTYRDPSKFATIIDRHMGRRWIPVGERLPEIGVAVLIPAPPGADPPASVARLETADRVFYEWCAECEAYNERCEPTHWQPLPPPPSED